MILVLLPIDVLVHLILRDISEVLRLLLVHHVGLSHELLLIDVQVGVHVLVLSTVVKLVILGKLAGH